jgi:hypothetical protein
MQPTYAGINQREINVKEKLQNLQILQIFVDRRGDLGGALPPSPYV